jgi:hypothetical protein
MEGNEIINIILEFLNEIEELLSGVDGASTGMSDMFTSFSGIFDGVGNASTGIASIFESLGTLLAVIFGFIVTLGSALVTGVGLVATIIGAIASFLLSLALFLLLAIPTYRTVKHLGGKHAWMVWLPIPVAHFYICSYVLFRASGKEKFELFHGKVSMRGSNAFLLYLLTAFFGPVIITTLTTLVGTTVGLIPVVGQILTVLTPFLGILPQILCALAEFVFLRDVLDRLRPEPKENRIASLIVSFLDAFITLGFARYVYMFAVMNKKPKYIDVECVPVKDTESKEV